MAKKFSHAVCGRTFKTANGKKTHVNCTPIAKNTPAPAVNENAAAEKALLAELTSELMSVHGIGWVKANIRARKIIAAVA